MSGLTAFSSEGAVNNVTFMQIGKVIKDVGKAGIASIVLGSSPSAPAHVSHNIANPAISIGQNVTSGVLSRKSKKLLGNEKEFNQLDFNVFNPSGSEYYNNYYTNAFAISLTPEANLTMPNEKDDHFVNEDIVFELIYDPSPKARLNLPDIQIFKGRSTDIKIVDDFAQEDIFYKPTPKRTFTL